MTLSTYQADLIASGKAKRLDELKAQAAGKTFWYELDGKWCLMPYPELGWFKKEGELWRVSATIRGSKQGGLRKQLSTAMHLLVKAAFFREPLFVRPDPLPWMPPKTRHDLEVDARVRFCLNAGITWRQYFDEGWYEKIERQRNS